MTEDNSDIYDRLDVPKVVNATGTKTRIGGSLIREEAVEAMVEAAGSFVRLSDLQAQAGELISDVTGAEAGYVTSGASAGLLLGTAACIAGDDVEVMNRLPDTEGIPDEVIMPRTHRTGYDHAIRGAGANIVDVGTNDHHLGTGAENVEPWEIDQAISDDTAAVGYVQKPYTSPPLERVIEIAHNHDVPVIVDAAAELPPTKNLSRFIEMGVDLVVFSGGKALRGPQTTGILAGRENLIQSAAIQHLDMHAAGPAWSPPADLVDTGRFDGVPRQGIGRPMKVGKEELAGLIRALECFREEDEEELCREWRARTEQMTDGLAGSDVLETAISGGDKTAVAPEVVVTVDEEQASTTTAGLVDDLRQENPRVFVGADGLHECKFTLNPMCLTDEEANYVVDRILDSVNA